MEFTKLSNQVIGCAIEVHKQLGPGLLESTYERCFVYELELNKIKVQNQLSLPIKYKGINFDCGYKIDILVENELIIELKSVNKILGIHEAQLLTYMKLSEKTNGMLINFNEELLKDGLKTYFFN